MQKLFYNVTGQSLIWDAPEGRPASVTSVSVFEASTGDDGTAESATTGAAAIETDPDTTFDAVSGAGQTDPRIMYLTATTGIAVGRVYRVTNADGESEEVEIVSVDDGVSATARHNLENAYTTADTFESTRISISIDATWVADSTNISDDLDPNSGYRIRWEYVVDGVTYVHADYFNLVRYRASHDVTPNDIDDRREDWINRLPHAHKEDRGQRLIDVAHKSLAIDLHRFGLPMEMLRNRDVVNELTILKTLMMTSQNKAAITGDSLAYEIDRDEFNAVLDGLVRTNANTDIATDASGAGGKGSAYSLWEK